MARISVVRVESGEYYANLSVGRDDNIPVRGEVFGCEGTQIPALFDEAKKAARAHGILKVVGLDELEEVKG